MSQNNTFNAIGGNEIGRGRDFTRGNSALRLNELAYANIEAQSSKKNFTEDHKLFLKNFIKQMVLDPRNHWAPHVNGWYYINMVGGSWEDQVISMTSDSSNEFKEFSPNAKDIIVRAKKEFGHLIKDLDSFQMGIDYESISGRLRTISVATRTNISNEFSLSWKENADADVFRYHEYWYDFIEAHKKGFIPSTSSYADEDFFIEVPYFNAVWVAILKPFTMELQGLMKFMGVAPTSLPIKEFLGQRGASQATTYNISYKVVDVIVQMYDKEPVGPFYTEFMNDSKTFFSGVDLKQTGL